MVLSQLALDDDASGHGISNQAVDAPIFRPSFVRVRRRPSKFATGIAIGPASSSVVPPTSRSLPARSAALPAFHLLFCLLVNYPRRCRWAHPLPLAASARLAHRMRTRRRVEFRKRCRRLGCDLDPRAPIPPPPTPPGPAPPTQLMSAVASFHEARRCSGEHHKYMRMSNNLPTAPPTAFCVLTPVPTLSTRKPPSYRCASARSPFTPATSPAPPPDPCALHAALTRITTAPPLILDDMTEVTPKLFKGDGIGENTTDFLNAIRCRNLLSPTWQDDQKLEYFELSLKSGSYAKSWYTKLLPMEKDTFKNLVIAFQKQWPEKEMAVREKGELQEELLTMKLRVEEVGVRVEEDGIEEWGQVRWAIKVAEIAGRIGDDGGLIP
ncbi:hypothetical protein B0H10DRAFT_2225304 [Mycena sp. CBHHK59/15]|nr:hypothetical protein B0H10DRAFT_2225304 [Mycena sp. CBHHK59/15]